MSNTNEVATEIAKHAINLRESPPAKYVETFKTAEPEPVKPEPPTCYSYKQRGGSAELSQEQLERCAKYERELDEYHAEVKKHEAHRLLSANAAWRVNLATYIHSEAKRQVAYVMGED